MHNNVAATYLIFMRPVFFIYSGDVSTPAAGKIIYFAGDVKVCTSECIIKS